MFGEKAFELIKELDRNPDNVTPFNVRLLCLFFHRLVSLFIWFFRLFTNSQDEVVRQVLDETNAIFEQNHKDA